MPGKDLYQELCDKEFRDAFVEAHIDNGIAYQISGMRRDRDWDQKTLAEKAGTRQAVISRMEDPDYGRLSITTLKKIAAAFDVALEVKFVPFSEFVGSIRSLCPEFYTPPAFDQDEDMARIIAESEQPVAPVEIGHRVGKIIEFHLSGATRISVAPSINIGYSISNDREPEAVAL